MNRQLDKLRLLIRQKLESVPEALRQEESMRQIIANCFFNTVEQMGFLALPAWKPPRSTRESLDLVAVQADVTPPRIHMAMVADPVVELPRVRSLEWVDCEHKIYVTFSPRADKVKPTTLFLKDEYLHLDIFS